jgi:hypothetical protein
MLETQTDKRRQARPLSTMLRDPASRGRWETRALFALALLAVPLISATGLALPLPPTVERVAASLVPWSPTAEPSDMLLRPRNGRIRPSAAERRRHAAQARSADGAGASARPEASSSPARLEASSRSPEAPRVQAPSRDSKPRTAGRGARGGSKGSGAQHERGRDGKGPGNGSSTSHEGGSDGRGGGSQQNDPGQGAKRSGKSSEGGSSGGGHSGTSGSGSSKKDDRG